MSGRSVGIGGRLVIATLASLAAPIACADDVGGVAETTSTGGTTAESAADPSSASTTTSGGGSTEAPDSESSGGNSSTSADSSTTMIDGGDSSTTTTSVGGIESSSSEGSSSTGEPVIVDPTLPQFTDVTDEAGVWFIQGVAEVAPNCLIDQLGPGKNGFCTPERCIAGAAVGDVDLDGDLDLFVTRTRATNLLFLGDGAGSFTEATAASGITEYGHSAGAAFGDIDNDGDLDLYVATIASFAHLLYINDGTGHFTEDGLARNASIDSGTIHIGMTPTFGDFDLDGYLDLYVGEWTIVDALGETPSNSRLLRNRGDEAPGTFEDVTVAAGVDIDGAWVYGPEIAPGTYSFAAAFVDLDHDRYPELTIASDFGTSRLFWNNRDGTFTDRTTEAGTGIDQNGMGSAHADYDNDGDMDWYVTSITKPGETADNRLYRNTGQQNFVEIADGMGIADSGWGWGTAFFEADNDGDLDLVAVAGYYFAAHDDEPMKLWRNEAVGPMLDISDDVGFAGPRQRRGVLSWDYDDDGDLDLLITSNGDAPELYRNDTNNDADWLRVRVVGTTTNRDGLGARVYVRAENDGVEQMREIGTGSHFMGHGERTAHFGLGVGDAPVARVQVVWPASETVQAFDDVARNQTLIVVEQ